MHDLFFSEAYFLASLERVMCLAQQKDVLSVLSKSKV